MKKRKELKKPITKKMKIQGQVIVNGQKLEPLTYDLVEELQQLLLDQEVYRP